MINEDIIKILNRDLTVSTERGVFSTPSEITAHVNALIDASYSSRAISLELQEIGWQKCGSSRAKRKHDNKAQCYYWKENRQLKALLDPSASTNTQSETQSKDTSSDDDESLASINRRFRSAQASKESWLSKIRETESETAKHREKHSRLQLEKDRGELVSVKEVVSEWEMRLNELKIELFNLPLKYSSRWSSINDETIIQEELERELNALCTRLSEGKNEAIKTKDERVENDRETDNDSEAI